MIKWFSKVLLVVLLASCGSANGKRYQVDNLEIYYSDKVPFEYVIGLGEFFQKNHLIHATKKHSIKLGSTSNEFVLFMILNDSLEQVPEDLLKEIEYLEDAIATKVFKNLNFAIVITDAYFNPILKPKN
ncbi:MAG: hypothetical protein R3279_12940 [Putridiphycobacter sp.]|nr:hypothetical protein [Putridiphycobacter sp.]